MRWIKLTRRALALAALGLPFAGCDSSGGVTAAVPAGLRPDRSAEQRKIQHVVIVIQENRSFNDLFYGFKGATTAQYGYDTQGDKIKIEPVVLETTWDVQHSSIAFFDACNGTGSVPGTDCQMNGFNLEGHGCGQSSYPACPIEHPQYAYVPHSETKPYFEMANQYVLADQMYPSNLDGSFTSHQYIIAGQSESAVNFPDAAWGCSGGSGDTVSLITQQRLIKGSETACWDTMTLGGRARRQGDFMGILRDACLRIASRCLERVPSHQSYLQRSRLEQRRHQPALAVLDRRFKRQTQSRELGHADRREFGPPGLGLEDWSIVGGFGGQRDR